MVSCYLNIFYIFNVKSKIVYCSHSGKYMKNIKMDEMDGHDVAELVLALEVTAEVQS